MSTTKNNIESRMERAYGAFISVAVSDAAGATLEFFREEITEEIALNAMKMPGGGKLQVGKSQFTDDTELAISLAFAFYDKDPRNGLPIEDIAQGYSEWYHSKPFDMGTTCARAFSTDNKQDRLLSNQMMKFAASGSYMSEANGALMRICPMAIWSIGESIPVIAHNAKMDAMLSHPNQVCQDCNVIVVLAIEYLIRHPSDYKGVIKYIDDYVYNNIRSKVRNWYFKDSLDISELDCSKNIGWVKFGFIQAIYYLRNNTSYETAIKEVLIRGGDTDTNAAIVGSVLGALHGINGIPKYMLEPVLAFDPTNPGKGQKRPAKYSASNIYGLTHQMLTHEIAQKR
jgi:ADP-ribosyl-[dinitrogen reductase] hydrolase